MNRRELQQLSRLRVQDARVLLDNGRYLGAYYLLGYAVECALKACIAKQIRRYDFPDRRQVNDSYTHDLEKLLNVSGLQGELDQESATNSEFSRNWSIVKEWSESFRYEITVPEPDVRDFYHAFTERRNGVLRWLMKFW